MISSKRFEGKVAIVTGSTQGIGYSISHRLGLEGASVVISSRNQKNVDEATQKLKSQGIQVLGLVCHVSNAQQRKDLIHKTLEKFGKIDVIVSSVAVNPITGKRITTIMGTQESILDKMWEVNIKAPILLMKALAFELGPEVRVNCVASGVVPTRFSEIITTSEALMKIVLDSSKLKRLGTPEEIAAAAVFLASDDASYITGETLVQLSEPKFQSSMATNASSSSASAPVSASSSSSAGGSRVSMSPFASTLNSVVYVKLDRVNYTSPGVLNSFQISVVMILKAMGKRFEGKVAIVTGSTQGIGYSIAHRLGLEGASVVVSSRNQENVDEATQKLKGQGIQVLGLVCHVSNAQHRKDLIHKTLEKFGKIDVIVSNAAANPMAGKSIATIMGTQESILDKMWEVNIKAPILLMQALASELGPEVRVNCVASGVVPTRFSEILTTSETLMKIILDSSQLKRLGTPEEIAAAAAFLASDDASYITGETLVKMIRSKRFEGKVAIVTGSTQGIGYSIAHRLGLEGASVVISSRNQENVDEATQKLKGQGIQVLGLVCHVSNAQQRKDLIHKTVEKFGKIDVIVLNAAVNPMAGKSIATIMGTQESILDKMWEALASELGPEVRVNCVASGVVPTRFGEIITKSETVMKIILDSSKLKRLGTPEEIAAAAVFFGF
ncbi:hypothetical protein F8388_027284 [Cannabis sativa]|uniref:Uncharacterized protein n=1 Tax=Cannabis sativa TaxID=3483 RepID=A0A7J6FPG8_CANSA|nr:hypothetical protein F8388_027284 [Cannabis sativa]